MIEVLFTFEATTSNGFMVGSHRIDERIHYREFYKKKSSYVFTGKEYIAYCLFNCSRPCSEKHALKIVSSMLGGGNHE